MKKLIFKEKGFCWKLSQNVFSPSPCSPCSHLQRWVSGTDSSLERPGCGCSGAELTQGGLTLRSTAGVQVTFAGSSHGFSLCSLAVRPLLRGLPDKTRPP